MLTSAHGPGTPFFISPVFPRVELPAVLDPAPAPATTPVLLLVSLALAIVVLLAAAAVISKKHAKRRFGRDIDSASGARTPRPTPVTTNHR